MFDHSNFTYKNFIDYVIEKMHLNDVKEPTKSKIKQEILHILGDRILYATANAMTEENLDTFNTMKEENPNLTVFEILFLMADQIPVLYEVMMKHINDLAEELIYDVERLDNALAERKEAETKKSNK